MTKIAVVTDTMSAITNEEAAELGIKIVPMPFIVDGKEYLEGIDLSRKEFFDMLNRDLDVSTSQPSIYYVREVWDDLLKDYDEIVYIPMSSGLSKSYEAANNEANLNYNGKVYVVDNKRISATQRESVLDALELIKLGYRAKEIKEILENVRLESKIYIMIDTLKYLKKGGRITATAAALGGMLKIKPVLVIHGEKLDKYRMRNRTLENGMDIMIEACINDINGYLYEKDGRTNNVRIAIAYADSVKDKVEIFKEKIRSKLGNVEITACPLALSIACHTGNGAIAIGITKELPDKYTKLKYVNDEISLSESRI